ncbi:hypothetical protein AB0301_12945, partial [Microbacterium profundi]
GSCSLTVQKPIRENGVRPFKPAQTPTDTSQEPYLAAYPLPAGTDASHPEAVAAATAVRERLEKLLETNGQRSVDSFHRELGSILWEYCGMERNAQGLEHAITLIRGLREQFWNDVKVTGHGEELNQALERAGRVADFFELAELMCIDALHRDESCGAHFRAESQTEEGEAQRKDDEYTYVAAWEFTGAGTPPCLHKEELGFEYVELQQRSYK